MGCWRPPDFVGQVPTLTAGFADSLEEDAQWGRALSTPAQVCPCCPRRSAVGNSPGVFSQPQQEPPGLGTGIRRTGSSPVTLAGWPQASPHSSLGHSLSPAKGRDGREASSSPHVSWNMCVPRAGDASGNPTAPPFWKLPATTPDLNGALTLRKKIWSQGTGEQEGV